MGISSFFSKFVKNLEKNVVQRNKPDKIKGLCFDLNGTIHPIAQKVFMYDKAKQKYFKNKSFYEKTSSANNYDDVKKDRSYLSFEKLEEEFYKELTNEIIKTIIYFDPYEFVILAVDGVAPLAKISQQRTRRFVSSSSDDTPLGGFHMTMIGPGTPFMQKLDSFILNIFLPQKVKSIPANYVVYSSYKIPGEGEHKIFERLRDSSYLPGSALGKEEGFFYDPTNNDPVVIWGLDSDLILLSCVSSTKNIYFARESFNEIVNIELFKNQVVTKMLSFCDQKDKLYENNFNNIITDFIIIACLVGNDFLPANFLYPSLLDNDIFSSYCGCLKKYVYKSFMCLTKTDQSKELNFTFLFSFFEMMKDTEKSKMIKMKKDIEEGSLDYIESFSPLYEKNYEKSLIELVKSLYEKEHAIYDKMPDYKKTFNVTNYCADYLNGFLWVFKYYTEGIFSINTAYTFPYLISPSFTIIMDYLENENNFFNKRKENVLRKEIKDDYFISRISEGEQLLSILPNRTLTKNIFDEEIKKGGIKGLQYLKYCSLTEGSNPLSIFSPDLSSITFFKEGKRQEHEKVPILSRVDFHYMKTQINELYAKSMLESAVTKASIKKDAEKDEEIEDRIKKIKERAETYKGKGKIKDDNVNLLWGKEDYIYFERVEKSKMNVPIYASRKPFVEKGDYAYFVKIRKVPEIIPKELNQSVSLDDLEINLNEGVIISVKEVSRDEGKTFVPPNSPKTTSKLIQVLERQRDAFLKKEDVRLKQDVGFEFFME